MSQVEGDTGLDSELVEEMENVIGQFKAREAQEQGLREQLGENQRALEERDAEVGEREEQLRQAQGEIDVLRDQIQTLSSTVERQTEELQMARGRDGELEQQLEAAWRDVASSREESNVLREANRELQTLREKLETRIARCEEQNRRATGEFTEQLETKNREIRELEDTRTRVAVMEENEEHLVSEREALAKRLMKAEHELAGLRSVVQSMEAEKGVESGSEVSQDGEVERELQEQV